MEAILVPFMLLSGLGFVLSVYAHIMSLLKVPLMWGESVWFLHIGIFVVWLPAVLISQRVLRDAPQKEFWRIIMIGCPDWMKTLQKAVVVYAVANFLYFLYFSSAGSITAGTDPTVIRGFSGHWLIFYGAAFSILYSVHQRPDLLKERKCPSGHAVSHSAEFCATCGAHIHVTKRNA